ncbi:LacI family DNA-binding transcriptional regulator [Sphingobacterium sp. Mn56C]|uniref:LacI family DNA-binding transcriptional regulator n=1 Tax=Sphingobacterium sp. Mn56C TaxID=3395261 RepID=UPI003BCD61E3
MTLKELAQKLGLSASTVSKALNDSYEISNDTKQRVRDLADMYKYKPNILAKSLKTGRSNTIGVIIPYLSNPFQSQILEGAHQAAYDSNYKLIFMQSRENIELEQDSLQALCMQNIDGIIISPCANSCVKYLKQISLQVPLVLVDRIDYDLDTHKIGVDNEKGAYLATQHLIDMGRKDILLLSVQNIGVTNKRIVGYKKALLANYLDFKEEYIISVEYEQAKDNLITNLTHLLAKKLNEFNHPIGLLGTTDTLTVGSLGILSNLGVAVPEQVAVVGFANTEAADSMNPALSTVVQPAKQMGYQAVEKLVELIHHRKRLHADFDTIVLESTLVPRKSTVS